MSNEDKIAREWIEANPDATARTEVPYNYYGDRGIVDLVFVHEPEQSRAYHEAIEIKSESAVRNATGANEIIRQFNKQREYYVKGRDDSPRGGDIEHKLIFECTPHTLEHVFENRALYNTAQDSLMDFIGMHRIGTPHVLALKGDGFYIIPERYHSFAEIVPDEMFSEKQWESNELAGVEMSR